MGLESVPYMILVFSLLFAFSGLSIRVAQLLGHPDTKNPSPPKASPRKGIAYSFTIGMLPWKKESARLHKLAYLRGALLHIGIFASIILLFTSLANLKSFSGSVTFSPALGLGFLAGMAAISARLTDRNLRILSRPDDYISLSLVTLMLLIAMIFTLNIVSHIAFWGAISALCLYLPWSKIPHVVFFFFARNNFGTLLGSRGVLPGPKTDNLREIR